MLPQNPDLVGRPQMRFMLLSTNTIHVLSSIGVPFPSPKTSRLCDPHQCPKCFRRLFRTGGPEALRRRCRPESMAFSSMVVGATKILLVLLPKIRTFAPPSLPFDCILADKPEILTEACAD